MKKTKYHYHTCSGCGRWKHEGPCNLSVHCSCGFKHANDFPHCVKGRKLEIVQTPPADLLKKALRQRVNNKINDKQFFNAAYGFQVAEDVATELLFNAYAKKEKLAA